MVDILDKTLLLERSDCDREFLADMVKAYGKDRITLMSQIRAALSRRDGRASADAAHAMSGLARNFSPEPALEAARRLEKLVKTGEFFGAWEALASLKEETECLEVAIREILRKRAGTKAGERRLRGRHLQAERPIRVIAIDNQELVRSGIRFMLRAFDDIELVGEALSGAEGLRLCERLSPDVVLMDVWMRNMDGVAATRTIKRQYPDTQVLLFTVYHTSDLVSEAMQAGAIGYVMKNASSDELAGAIRAARDGVTTLSPETATDPASPSTVTGDDLTYRERQVLGLLTKGMRNNQIAKQINKSPYTVRHYVSELIAKLGAKNRAEAAAIAVKYRLVD